MAIARADYEIFRRLARDGHVPPKPSILEIGEAEWYGDVPISELVEDIEAWPDREHTYGLVGDVIAAAQQRGLGQAGAEHALAKLVYYLFFNYSNITAWDLHGTDQAIKCDLNHPMGIETLCDVAYNTGTAEHVFRISQVLETVHYVTRHSGLMIHCFPFTGLIDHGFWNVNPTLILDLARANAYEILYLTVWALGEEVRWIKPATALRDIHEMVLPENAWMHVVYRKTSDAPFVVPMQGVYGEHAAELIADWKAMR